ncbi:hypothetical protein WJX79_007174 [Trebouxia sp. C0005]
MMAKRAIAKRAKPLPQRGCNESVFTEAMVLMLSVKHGQSTYQLTKSEDAGLSVLMQDIEELTGVPVRYQKLICQGKVLDTAATLKALKVKNGSKLMLMTSGSQTQGQVAVQQVIKDKAAAAKQRGEDFRQKQNKCSKTNQTPAVNLQARASRWAAVGIASLRDEHLTNLPEELWPIGASIRVADFGSNKLTSVSAQLSAFSALQRLRLSHNHLTDEGIPWPALAAMPQLVVLALDHNRLVSLSDSLGSLTNLQKLSCSHNAVARLPGVIGRLTHLHHLDLRCNSIAELPQELSACQALVELDAAHNQLSALPSQLCALHSLKTLMLDSNRLTSVPPEIFSDCTSLFTLSLHDNPITAAALRDLKGFTEFDIRRKGKYSKQMDMHVMTPSNGFDEGADAAQWQAWAPR